MKLPVPARSGTALRLAVNLATVLAPALMLCLLLQFAFSATPGDYVPWSSDQLDYWHETLTFREKGFTGGFYGYEETTGPIGGYGGHGFLLPMFYAALSMGTGWNYATPVYYNTAFLALAWLIFLALARPNLKESLFCLAFSLTYTPIFYWQCVFMQEPMQFALAIVMAGLFVLLLRERESGGVGPALRYGCLAFVFVMALFRLTWAFLFFPLFFLVRKDAARVGPILRAVSLTGLAAAAYVASTAPWPYDVSPGEVFRKAVGGDPLLLIHYFWDKISPFFAGPDLLYPWLASCEILFFLALCLVFLARDLLARRGRQATAPFPAALATACFMLCSLLAFLVALYHLEEGYIVKHMGPVFVFCLLILMGKMPLRHRCLLLVFNLLLLPAFLHYYRSQYYTSYVRGAYLRQYIGKFEKDIAPYVVYEANAPSRWCNTLDMMNFPGVLTALPPGIAFNNVYKKETMEGRLKARYILAANEAAHAAMSRRNSLRFLTRTSYGTLYRNESAP